MHIRRSIRFANERVQRIKKMIIDFHQKAVRVADEIFISQIVISEIPRSSSLNDLFYAPQAAHHVGLRSPIFRGLESCHLVTFLLAEQKFQFWRT